MSDAGFLNFDASEFVVVEDAIEFDETIQRPEAVRFYTLQEQEVDAFEKMLPVKGRVSQATREKLQYDLDRMHGLYQDYILPTMDDYMLREPPIGTNLSWVNPVYATPELTRYDPLTSWAPLFVNRDVPNFYPRMISALPRPFADTQEGTPYPVTRPIEFFNADGTKSRRALPVYETTKTVVHQDRPADIVPYPIEGTADVVPFVGYYLSKRPLDLPNPLADHPFLAENKPTFVESTATLKDVLPSLDAILTHAVPATSDPYGVAGPYLKLYDIRMESIPWSSWKSRFPPAEVVSVMPERVNIPFPTHDAQAPSQKILDGYQTTYAPGLSAREWLMRQADGGEFVIRALQSAVIDNGSVESIPGINLPLPGYPATTIDECALTGLNFQDFTTKGLLRRTWTIEKGKDIVKLECVPLEFVAQERARVGYLDRKVWKETTGTELLETHLRALRRLRTRADPVSVAEPHSRTPAKPDSQVRLQAIAILQDDQRHVRDKVHDLQEIMRDQILSNNVYSDPDGAFVMCSHTFAMLDGDFAADRRAFYDKWTAQVDGFRVCKFCGEQIGTTDLVDQDEFNEDGFRIQHVQALETPPTVVSESLKTYATGLRAILPLFDQASAMDMTCFTVLSLLQVLPSGDFMDRFLKVGRTVAAKLGKDDSEKTMRYKGTLGIALAVLVLQGHVPILIPRRSFGSRPFKLSGYPRDAAEPEQYSIVDNLLFILENTFRGFPGSLSGPTRTVIRAVLSTPKDVRKNVYVFLKNNLLTDPGIRDQLETARRQQPLQAEAPTENPLLPSLQAPPSLGTITSYATCPSILPVLEGKNPPRIRQAAVPLREGLQAARSRVEITPVTSVRVPVAPVPKSEIQKRIPLQSAVQGTSLEVKDPYRTNLAIASRLADLARAQLPIRAVDPGQNAAELRDLARGLVYEAVRRTKNVDDLLKKDIALFCLTSDYKKQKATALKIRATERLNYVQRMAALTDQEREVNMELAKRGMAPIMITLEERGSFARQVEEDTEIGVGLPRDVGDQGESNAAAGVDYGDYGDYVAVPMNDGRDYADQSVLDDQETSI